MSALIRKEVRLLLPTWIIGLLMAFSVWLMPDKNTQYVGWVGIFPFLLCPALVVMLSLSSFGSELSAGTFSNLLAQPISRARVWRTKTLLLAAGIAVIACVWLISFLLHNPRKTPSTELWDIAVITVLFALAVYSGGLWTVLLFRQVAAAFWLMLLIPAALAMSITYLFRNHPGATEPALIIGLSIYSVAGFCWARWMFLRAQDVAWTGGTIELPEWRGLAKFTFASSVKRKWRPRAALLAKEFQLHQSQFIMAGALALLHLGVIAWRNFGGEFVKQSTTEFILNQFWCLWLVMPLLVGSTAVAEERRLGTLESQLCLPAKCRTQFVLKLFVVLFLSVLLGVVMPLLLEGSRILPDAKFNNIDLSNPYLQALSFQSIFWQTTLLDFLALISYWWPFIFLAALATGIGAFSFYASTLGRNTLQVLAPAVLTVLVATTLLFNAYRAEVIFGYPIWRGWLIYLIGVPVMTLVLIKLAFWNYQRVFVGGKVWWRNFLVLTTSLAFVMTATSAIYHRAWERLMPLEPAHGVARLTKPVTLHSSNNSMVMLQFPDGRVWTDHFGLFSTANWSALLTDKLTVKEIFGGGRFLEGTNWSSVANCTFDIVGIQSNGSLWVSEQPRKYMFQRPSKSLTPEWIKLVRFGHDHDWKNVTGYNLSAFLLKNDGTLWRWGTNNFNGKKNKWPGLRAFEPKRLGTDSNWSDIFSIGYTTYFQKNNGSVWAYPFDLHGGSVTIQLDENILLGRELGFEHFERSGPVWVWDSSRPGGSGFKVGVHNDGTLRKLSVWGRLPVSAKTFTFGLAKADIQIGQETNWTAVVGGVGGYGNAVVALKADGTLWKWNFSADPRTNLNAASCVQLSTHSDWIAISEWMGGILSLAADGSLWLWRFEPANHYYGQSSDSEFQPLLAVSRQPQHIANIFNKQN